MHENPPSLGDFLRILDASGLSDREASERLYLHENYVNRLRRGEREFRPVYYLALAYVIGQL